MTLVKRFYLLLMTVFVFSATVYYMGCASAESTTGKLAFQQKDFAKAEGELKKGLAIDQTDDEGWFMLGYSQIELGKNEEAQSSFKKSLSISPNFGSQITGYWIEKYNAGAKDFKNGIDAEEKKNNAGAKSFYQEALKSFTAATSIIPDSLKALSALGETYLALGEQDKALLVLKELAAKSNSAESAERVAKVIFNTGINMMSLKNYDAALKTFQEVLTLPSLPKTDPYYETSQYNCGLASAKLGEDMRIKDENSNYKEKFSQALTYLEPLSQGMSTKKLEPQVWELLVSVYANLGQTDKAQDALKKKDALKN